MRNGFILAGIIVLLFSAVSGNLEEGKEIVNEPYEENKELPNQTQNYELLFKINFRGRI